MSDAENFVARWSRLKRDTAKEKTEADAALSNPQPDDAHAIAAEQQTEGAPTAGRGSAKAPFDPASLPPIESITAASDIRAFLQTGVPGELTRAALRRVWTTDPAIRDFIGIAENQWDFTDPTAMPGFGPLEATDDIRELVAQAMGKLGQVSEPSVEAAVAPEQDIASSSRAICKPPQKGPSQVAGMPAENELPSNDGNSGSSVEVQNSSVNVAAQHDDRPAQDGTGPNRRAHGRALPQ
jgi:hypothetical protein